MVGKSEPVWDTWGTSGASQEWGEGQWQGEGQHQWFDQFAAEEVLQGDEDAVQEEVLQGDEDAVQEEVWDGEKETVTEGLIEEEAWNDEQDHRPEDSCEHETEACKGESFAAAAAPKPPLCGPSEGIQEDRRGGFGIGLEAAPQPKMGGAARNASGTSGGLGATPSSPDSDKDMEEGGQEAWDCGQEALPDESYQPQGSALRWSAHDWSAGDWSAENWSAEGCGAAAGDQAQSSLGAMATTPYAGKDDMPKTKGLKIVAAPKSVPKVSPSGVYEPQSDGLLEGPPKRLGASRTSSRDADARAGRGAVPQPKVGGCARNPASTIGSSLAPPPPDGDIEMVEGSEGVGADDVVDISNVPASYDHNVIEELHQAMGLDVSTLVSSTFTAPDLHANCKVCLRYTDRASAIAAATAFHGQEVASSANTAQALSATLRKAATASKAEDCGLNDRLACSSVIISAVPTHYNEQTLWDLLAYVGMDTAALVASKFLPPVGEACQCIARFCDAQAAEMAMGLIHGQEVETTSGETRQLSVRLATDAESTLDEEVEDVRTGGDSPAGKRRRMADGRVLEDWTPAPPQPKQGAATGRKAPQKAPSHRPATFLPAPPPVVAPARTVPADPAVITGRLFPGKVKQWERDKRSGYVVLDKDANKCQHFVFFHESACAPGYKPTEGHRVYIEAVWDESMQKYRAEDIFPLSILAKVPKSPPSFAMSKFALRWQLEPVTVAWLKALDPDLQERVVKGLTQEHEGKEIKASIVATLRVENLPKDDTDEFIAASFGMCGQVKSIIKRDNNVVFVRMASAEEARVAIECLDGDTPFGSTKPISLRLAEEKELISSTAASNALAVFQAAPSRNLAVRRFARALQDGATVEKAAAAMGGFPPCASVTVMASGPAPLPARAPARAQEPSKDLKYSVGKHGHMEEDTTVQLDKLPIDSQTYTTKQVALEGAVAPTDSDDGGEQPWLDDEKIPENGQEVSTHLLVTGLAEDVDEGQLKELCSQCGEVRSCRIFLEGTERRATVEMAGLEEAQLMCETLNGEDILGLLPRLKVTYLHQHQSPNQAKVLSSVSKLEVQPQPQPRSEGSGKGSADVPLAAPMKQSWVAPSARPPPPGPQSSSPPSSGQGSGARLQVVPKLQRPLRPAGTPTQSDFDLALPATISAGPVAKRALEMLRPLLERGGSALQAELLALGAQALLEQMGGVPEFDQATNLTAKDCGNGSRGVALASGNTTSLMNLEGKPGGMAKIGANNASKPMAGKPNWKPRFT